MYQIRLTHLNPTGLSKLRTPVVVGTAPRMPKVGVPLVVVGRPLVSGALIRRVSTDDLVAVSRRSDQVGVVYFETRSGSRYRLEEMADVA